MKKIAFLINQFKYSGILNQVVNLANSYFMAWRSAESKEEKEVFFSKAVNYCYDTIYNQKNDEEFDRANILLMHIYTEDGNYKKALQACNDFINNNPTYDIDIVFAIIDDPTLNLGINTAKQIGIKIK